MSQHDFVIDNASGLAVRTDLNNALQALVSQSAGTSAPSATYAYQPWYDTTTGLLKFRNGANNAWVTFGPVADSTKFELYVTNTKRFDIDTDGNATFTATGGVKVPVGTTAQRPTPAQGHIRYNSTLSQFEGYDGSNWGSIGGAGNAKLDTFSGNGSTTGFTLTSDPGSENNTIVTISGVVQHKSTYSVSGTTLTFSSAPPTGTNNIEVMYNVALSIGTPSDNTVSTAKLTSDVVKSLAKWCGKANTSGTLAYNHNLTSVTDDGTGLITATIATDFSSANWVPFVNVERGSGSVGTSTNLIFAAVKNATQAAGACSFECTNNAGYADPTNWFFGGFGDQ